MRKVQFSALTLLSVALMACGSNQTPNAAQESPKAGVSQQAGEGFWSTSGSKIIDQNGQVVRMTGINWFGFETANFMPHGLWSVNYKDVLNQVKAMGFTVLRIPFSNEMLNGPKMPSGLNDFANPELKGLNSLQILDKIIEHSGTLGLKIFLDRHRPDSAGQSHLWYTSAYPESKWISDWVFLANRYKGNPTVIGADLHNEPHSVEGTGPNSCWGCGDPAQDWRLAAEKAGNAILAVNPDWLIIVEGNECWASDGSAVKPNQWNPNPNMNCNWWGGNLMGAQTFPVRLTKPNKLVYSSHDYGMSVYGQQPWFTDPSFPSTLEPHWDKYWGYLVKNNIAPVIVGEFGSTLQDPKDQVWLPSLLKYMEKIGASWTYWSLNPNSGDTKGILLDDWKTIDTVRYNVVQPYLVPLSGGGTPTNQAPTVAISSPTEGQSFASGSTVNVAATASDTDGTVSKVDFFVDGVLRATDTTAPYAFSATGLTAGAHAIRAVATDNGGASSSVTRNITIQANAAPTLSVTAPTEGQNFAVGTAVNVAATATDSDGVAKVDFFVDGVLRGTDTTAPYTYAATGLTAGAHTVRVTATDTKGAASSVTRNISVGSVNTPPTLSVSSPTEGQSFPAGSTVNVAATATDSDGIAKVDFYVDNILRLSDTTAPYSFAAAGLAAGAHNVRVVATDTKGAATTVIRNFSLQQVVTGTCKVVYTKQNDWGTGATINVDISNTGSTAVNNWTLAFNFSGTEKVRDLWNGTFTQTGQSVSIKPVSWNSTINPGQTINLGFNLEYTGSSTNPVSFTLNGQTCTK